MSNSAQSKVFLQEMDLTDCSCIPAAISLVMEKLSCKVSPSERAGHSMSRFVLPAPYDCPDAKDEEYILLIGGSNINQEHFNDVWVFHISSKTWFPLRRGGAASKHVDLPARSSHISIVLPITSSRLHAGATSLNQDQYGLKVDSDVARVLVYGGQRVEIIKQQGEFIPSVTSLQDQYVLELWRSGSNPLSIKTAWVEIEPSTPKLAGVSSAFGWQGSEKEVYIFGGANSEGPTNVLRKYNLDTNEQTIIDTNGAVPLSMEMYAHSQYGEKVYIWGGRGIEGVYNKMYELDCATQTWKELGQSPKICGTASCLLNIDKTQYCVSIGGCTEESIINDVLVSNISKMDAYSKVPCSTCKGIAGWSKLEHIEDESIATSDSVFYHLASNCVTLQNKDIFIFGGTSGDRYYNNTILLTLK